MALERLLHLLWHKPGWARCGLPNVFELAHIAKTEEGKELQLTLATLCATDNAYGDILRQFAL